MTTATAAATPDATDAATADAAGAAPASAQASPPFTPSAPNRSPHATDARSDTRADRPSTPATFVSSFDFTLPRGYVDRDGNVHRTGTMRLATAGDEIWPQNDPIVRENPAYLSVLLLTRTVTRLGSLPEVDVRVIENLWASDLAFLQDMYRRINTRGHTEVEVACPSCEHGFVIDITGGDPSGES